MIEAISHIFGVCGDGHPSIAYGIGVLPILLAFKNRVILYVRTLLQRLGLVFRRNKI